jgi:hypothetical protein
MVTTAADASSLPPSEALLPPTPKSFESQFRITQYGRGVERVAQDNSPAQVLTISREPGFYVQSVWASPAFNTDNTVYVLSEFDLFRSTDGGGTWARWTDDRLLGRDYSNKLSVVSLSPPLEDDQHQIYLGTANGEFWVLNPEDLEWLPEVVAAQWPTVLSGEWISAIEVSPDGDVWLGTWGNGLALYSAGEIQTRYSITTGLTSQYVGALTIAPDGTVWAGGDLPPGVGRYDGQNWTDTGFEGLDAASGVLDLIVGPFGSSWASGLFPGLFLWAGQTWEYIPAPDNQTGLRTPECEFDSSGLMWCATSAGLVYYSNGEWFGEPSSGGEAIEFGPDGASYYLTSEARVWRHDGQAWTELPHPLEKAFLHANDLLVASDGSLWVASDKGAFRFNGRSWQQFTAQDGLPANDVLALAEDAEGWLWFGTENGAARVDPRQIDLAIVNWPQAPEPTPTAEVVAPPTPCALPVDSSFSAALDASALGARLGCPVSEAILIQGAFQPFEYGAMLWRVDELAVLVLREGGPWSQYSDTFDETKDPLYDPSLSAPEGLHQPVRGFGKVWREQLGGPDSGIGWALAPERRHDPKVQTFEQGWVFTGPEGESYILLDDGSWETAAQ